MDVLWFLTDIYAAVSLGLFRFVAILFGFCLIAVALSCVALSTFPVAAILFFLSSFFSVLSDGVPSHGIFLLRAHACVRSSGGARRPNLAVPRHRSQVLPLPFGAVSCRCRLTFCSFARVPLHYIFHTQSENAFRRFVILAGSPFACGLIFRMLVPIDAYVPSGRWRQRPSPYCAPQPW